MNIIKIEMPGRDGTGPSGTFINCTDPVTGLTRPLYRYRNGSYVPPAPPAAAPGAYLAPGIPINPRYGSYVPRGYPYNGYGYPAPRYWGYGYGYGLGMRRGMGRGRGRRRW